MIDLLDIVSILLGGAIAYLAVTAMADRLKGEPTYIPLALGVGLILVLGYAFSEGFHALKAAMS